MALMFPPTFPTNDPANAADAAVFSALQNHLDAEWQVFYGCIIKANGEEGRIDFVVLHRQRGIAALAAVGPDIEVDCTAAERAITTMLREHGFLELFGNLPRIAAAAIPPDRCDEVLELIEAALPAVAGGGLIDPDWVEWTADRLRIESDLAARHPAHPTTDTHRGGTIVAPHPDERQHAPFGGTPHSRGGASRPPIRPSRRELLGYAGLAACLGAAVWVRWYGHDVWAKQAKIPETEPPVDGEPIAGTPHEPGAVLRRRQRPPLVPHEWWKQVLASNP